MLSILLLCVVVLLAFANGANDVSRGIATLVGSGVTRFKTAVVWGTVWTVAGALAAAFVGKGLLEVFSGGLLFAVPAGGAFPAAVAAGAALWIAVATWTGLPVSTTHAITGSLAGAGLAASGGALQWAVLFEKFLLPLALSPILALGLIFLLFPFLHSAIGRLRNYCVCLSREMVAVRTSEPGQAMMAAGGTEAIVVGENCDCASEPATMARLNVMDALHWLSAGAISFARGLNDAPKILALGLGAGAALGFSADAGFILVALAMGLGSLIAGFRVTETLARRVFPMSPSEGFLANLVTSSIVILASVFAFPVSTTHVCGSSIIGAGLRRGARSVQWDTARHIALAWIVTLPAAALFGAGALVLIRTIL